MNSTSPRGWLSEQPCRAVACCNEGIKLPKLVMGRPMTTCVLQARVTSEALRFNLRTVVSCVCGGGGGGHNPGPLFLGASL